MNPGLGFLGLPRFVHPKPPNAPNQQLTISGSHRKKETRPLAICFGCLVLEQLNHAGDLSRHSYKLSNSQWKIHQAETAWWLNYPTKKNMSWSH